MSSSTARPDPGLVIFIRRIPAQIGEDVLRTRLEPYLLADRIGVNHFELQKPRGKSFASLWINTKVAGEAFLSHMKSYPTNLGFGRLICSFERHDAQDGGAWIRDRKMVAQWEADLNSRKLLEGHDLNALTLHSGPQETSGRQSGRAFKLDGMNIGHWGYGRDRSPVYISEYSTYRPGEVLIGARSIVVLLFDRYNPDRWFDRIDFTWDFIETIYTQRGRVQSLMISCKYPPRMYRNVEEETPISMGRRLPQKTKQPKTRIPCLDLNHSKISGVSLTYELLLEPQQSLRPVQDLVEYIPDGPPSMRISVATMVPRSPYPEALQELNLALSRDASPFCIRFQIMKIALDGILAPEDAVDLLPIVKAGLAKGRKPKHCAQALRQLHRNLPFPGPQTPQADLDIEHVKTQFCELLDSNLNSQSAYRNVDNSKTLALINHARITPMGLYLEGPEPEVTNRVIRKYPEDTDSFIRVSFSDEDGEPLQFRFDTSNEAIHTKFLAILLDFLPIGGSDFRFLGFSQSSLRSHTAWFMAPFHIEGGQLLTPQDLIADLGDFSHLRSPAKCAARIGQGFTDTNGFTTVQASNEFEVPDVERNGRVFSDGCGLMAQDIALAIGRQYDRFHMKVKPNVFQIRFRGAKGVLSAHPGLKHGQVMIRPSMRKFETRDDDTHDLEICGLADKMRPMYLNRGLIKVLEDLGVPGGSFLQLANETIQRLQGSTTSLHKAAKLMENERVGLDAHMPRLLQMMAEIGVSPTKDKTLCAMVEMAAFCRLRSLKYKGRILVSKGVKLMGSKYLAQTEEKRRDEEKLADLDIGILTY